MTTAAEKETEPQPITPRQREVYDAIVDYCEANGYGPTIRELCKHFGWASPNGAMCHLRLLRDRGWISWSPRHSRTIRPLGGTR
jgi:repressor LexA